MAKKAKNSTLRQPLNFTCLGPNDSISLVRMPASLIPMPQAGNLRAAGKVTPLTLLFAQLHVFVASRVCG